MLRIDGVCLWLERGEIFGQRNSPASYEWGGVSNQPITYGLSSADLDCHGVCDSDSVFRPTTLDPFQVVLRRNRNRIGHPWRGCPVNYPWTCEECMLMRVSDHNVRWPEFPQKTGAAVSIWAEEVFKRMIVVQKAIRSSTSGQCFPLCSQCTPANARCPGLHDAISYASFLRHHRL